VALNLEVQGGTEGVLVCEVFGHPGDFALALEGGFSRARPPLRVGGGAARRDLLLPLRKVGGNLATGLGSFDAYPGANALNPHDAAAAYALPGGAEVSLGNVVPGGKDDVDVQAAAESELPGYGVLGACRLVPADPGDEPSKGLDGGGLVHVGGPRAHEPGGTRLAAEVGDALGDAGGNPGPAFRTADGARAALAGAEDPPDIAVFLALPPQPRGVGTYALHGRFVSYALYLK